jgi:hypothetical protein
MGIIKNQFDQICRNAIIRYSAKYSAELPVTTLLLYLNDQQEPAYLVQVNYKGVEAVTVLDLLERKLDFLDRGPFIEHFVKSMLEELAAETGIPCNELRIMIKVEAKIKNGLLRNREVKEVTGYLYKGVQYVKALDMGELLSDLKLMAT